MFFNPGSLIPPVQPGSINDLEYQLNTFSPQQETNTVTPVSVAAATQQYMPRPTAHSLSDSQENERIYKKQKQVEFKPSLFPHTVDPAPEDQTFNYTNCTRNPCNTLRHTKPEDSASVGKQPELRSRTDSVQRIQQSSPGAITLEDGPQQAQRAQEQKRVKAINISRTVREQLGREKNTDLIQRAKPKHQSTQKTETKKRKADQERKRISTLNGMIKTLQNRIPEYLKPEAKKLSKIETLRLAKLYIESLNECLSAPTGTTSSTAVLSVRKSDSGEQSGDSTGTSSTSLSDSQTAAGESREKSRGLSMGPQPFEKTESSVESDLIEAVSRSLSDVFGEGCQYSSYRSTSKILNFITSESQASGHEEIPVYDLTMRQDTKKTERNTEEQPSCYTEQLAMQSSSKLYGSHFESSLPLESLAAKERGAQPDTVYWENSQRLGFTGSCVLDGTVSAPLPSFEAVCHQESALKAETSKLHTNDDWYTDQQKEQHSALTVLSTTSTEPYKSSAKCTVDPARGFWLNNSPEIGAAQALTSNPLDYQSQLGQLTGNSLTVDQIPLQQTGCNASPPAEMKTVVSTVKTPSSAFTLYCDNFRKIYRLQDKKLSERDINSKAGMAWLKLTDEEKRPYILEQNHQKMLYKEVNPDYEYDPREKTRLIKTAGRNNM